MTLLFDTLTHTYRLDGQVIPSVTQVLSIANDFSFVDKALLGRAAQFGTAVHRMTELYDASELNESTLDVSLLPYLDAWKMFLNNTRFTTVESESLVYSKHGYAGTFDRIGYLDKKLTLVDIKTSATVARSTALQTAAYGHAWTEQKGQPIEQRVSVQLRPCQYAIRAYEDRTDFLTFLNFLNVYKWSHKHD
jgi:hypothetical protein